MKSSHTRAHTLSKQGSIAFICGMLVSFLYELLNKCTDISKDGPFEALTVVHEFRELDTQSLFDPANLFVHGKSLYV